MTEHHPTRRSVVRTAAWSVPAVTLATASPAFAASPPSCLSAAEPIIWQTVNVTVYTRVRTYTSLISYSTDATSKNVYTFTLPHYVRAGTSVPARPISNTSTLGKADAKAAYDKGGRTIQSGWIDTRFNWGGGLTPVTSTQRMTLSPTGITIPGNGTTQLVTSFTGTTPALSANAVGNYSINFVNPAQEPVTSNSSTYNGEQKAMSNWGIPGTARVHSMIPETIPASVNDWGTQGQTQSLLVANYTVLPAC